MNSLFRRAWLGLGFLLAVASIRAAPTPFTWNIYQTSHFELLTDGGEPNARRTLDRLERYRAAIAALPGAGPVSQLPTRVYLLESDALFKRVNPLNHAAAVYQSAPTENLLLIWADEERQTQGRTTLHEFTHLLFRRHLPDWPLWLNEGVAEAFATVQFKGDTATFGAPQALHLKLLNGHPWMPLNQLFAKTSRDQARWNQATGWLFYAESWMVAHYFFFEVQRRKDPATEQFLRLLSSGSSTAEALQKALNLDEAQLLDLLKVYFRSGRYGNIPVTIPQLSPEAARATVRAARPGEALAWLGDWCLGNDSQRETARLYYQESLKAAPENPFATLGLARLAAQERQFDEAQRLAREAVRLDPDNPWAHFWLGEILTQAAVAVPRKDGERVPIPREAIVSLRRATDLGPTLAPPWAALGMALVQMGDFSNEPLNALRKAWDLDPGDLRLLLDQARALLQVGRTAEAEKLIDNVILVGGTTPIGKTATRLKQALQEGTAKRRPAR